MDGIDAAAEAEDAPRSGRKEQGQPPLAAAEGADLGRAGEVARELARELLHAPDGRRVFAGDEQDHGASEAGKRERTDPGRRFLNGPFAGRERHDNRGGVLLKEPKQEHPW
ncbi:hypothetical protein O0235_02875 [Tepidiforma flava]|uniref:Uncharacterized protein n=1 Tax=Tepidiforma flava TaxID=3004094 RepID=A0ABY7M7K4_9CHLR|nr:hypothetical protein [Tepidiforma flava]WBL36516.1 hypothetical protein O0235_02875 [Tepidiforma flava]